MCVWQDVVVVDIPGLPFLFPHHIQFRKTNPPLLNGELASKREKKMSGGFLLLFFSSSSNSGN